jgi:hypothetical protein
LKALVELYGIASMSVRTFGNALGAIRKTADGSLLVPR